MRVLFVIHYPVFGGPHNQALRLAGPLQRAGVELVVALPREPGNAAERLRDAGLRVIELDLHRLRPTRDPRIHVRFALAFVPEILALSRLILRERIDLVLVGGLINPHAPFAARRAGIPVVWQILDTRTPPLLVRAVMPLVSRLADTVMTTGAEVARSHGALALGERLVVFYPPVDTTLFRADDADRASSRGDLGLSPTDLVIGTVANINPQKGHHTFVRAAAALRRTHPSARFVLLGATYPHRATYLRSVLSLAESLGLRPDADLIVRDPNGEVARLLNAIDVFWLCSEPRSEGAPTVVGEAMATGLPVVAADVGAVRELVSSGRNGYVVPAGDAEAIAEATAALLRQGDRASISAEARRRSVELFGLERCVAAHLQAFKVARRRRSRAAGEAEDSHRVEHGDGIDVRSILVCPRCRSQLDWSRDSSVACTGCGERYEVVDGVPVLVPAADAAHDDALEHKRAQAKFSDERSAIEFETIRPHGSPRLYRWLLRQKFDTSVRGLRHLVGSGTVLVVCGGSGMDAEMLEAAGGRVVVTDISLGAVERARERERRFGLRYATAVADVERLPFEDRSVDVVYVHDGLHHLAEPMRGLREMARVARRAISVTEPAAAAATRVAIRLGVAQEIEESGNRVTRLRREELTRELRERGFAVVGEDRYAMYYRHAPGAAERALSWPPLFLATRALLWLLNLLLGRFGNKLSVRAVRRDDPGPRPARPGRTA